MQTMDNAISFVTTIILSLSLILFLVAGINVQQDPQRILFFGDSITQAGVQPGGYISQLEEMLNQQGTADQFELIGAGVSGNKVYDLYLRLEEDVLSQHPDKVFIWIGVNDVWHKRTHGTGTDADKFVLFYNALIEKLQHRQIDVVLVTPAAIGEKTDFTNELDGDLNRYAQLVRDIASENGCALLDLRKLFLDYNLEHNPENREKGILTTDGVHLNEEGNRFVAEQMLGMLF